jgi:hypothetical protein
MEKINVEESCDRLVGDIDELNKNLLKSERFYRKQAEALFSRLRVLQEVPLTRGKQQSYVLYAGICMGFAMVLWKDSSDGGKGYVDGLLDLVVQEKKRKVRSTYNDVARHCCPGKDKRDYSRYAKVIEDANSFDWSPWTLYANLCENGGISALCGYNDPDEEALSQAVRLMVTEGSYKRKIPVDGTGPRIILAYKELDGTYSIKKIYKDGYEIIQKLVNLC